MASADVRDELLCSICLSLYTDPVTLRCGHNFCRVCIEEVLKTQDGSGVYSCPECREEFQERPVLKRNITLHNVAERFLSTQPHREEITGIRCTYRVDSPVSAAKSCLLCEASLCDKHLRVHSKSAEHVLTEPGTNLEARKCSVHKKILEYYCPEDNACICVSCSLAGEHRGHRVEMLDEASEKKKEKLRNVLQQLTTKREKTEERVRSLEEKRRKGQEKASGEVERVTALFIDIRRRLEDLEKKVLSEISRREQQMSLSLSDVIQKLEVKKDELSRKMRHIEELCNMTDPLTVLQEPITGDLCDPEEEGGDEDKWGHDESDEDTEEQDVGHEAIGGNNESVEETGEDEESVEETGEDVESDEDTGEQDVGHEAIGGHNESVEETGEDDESDEETGEDDESDEETGEDDESDEETWEDDESDEDTGEDNGGQWDVELISQLSHTLSDMIRDVTFHVSDPADILLDVNTAANDLLISDNLKTATWTEISQNRPETSERFQYPQVMSGRGFTSGRHYWDVKVGRSRWWRVGMCYPSIDRRGDQSDIGYSNKSWGLCGGWGYKNQYAVAHDWEQIRLPHQISSDRVRICLDYEAGRLSFYELCDPIRHLHTFMAAFNEPLHAVLSVYGGYIKILG